MDLSKLNLPADVRPEWTDKGEPWCGRGEEVECPALVACDGIQKCSKTRILLPTSCQPAIEAMASAIPGFLACERCKGSGTVSGACPDPQCGDSTWDHDCDEGRKVPCPRCRGTGKPRGTEGA